MDLKLIAKDINETFGFNVLPLVNKKPSISSWSKWQTEKQDSTVISQMNWNTTVTGIGAISGIEKLRVLDFDKVTDRKIVDQFLKELGLAKEYQWLVKSGNGYHIWFKCSDDEYLFSKLDGKKSVYKINPKEKDCDHIELRWKECQTVLPPSKHTNGNIYKYEFIRNDDNFQLPDSKPQTVSIGRLLSTLKKLCVFEKNENTVKYKTDRLTDNKKNEKINRYDKKLLNAIAKYLKGKINNYVDWMRIGFALASIGEDGRKYFLELSLGNPKYQDDETSINEKFDSFLKDYDGSIKLGSFIAIAKKYGYKIPLPEFWEIKNNNLRISQTKFLKFLEYSGFGKYNYVKEYIFIRVTNNIVKEVSTAQIKDYVTDYVRKQLPYKIAENFTKTNLLDELIRERNKLFGETFLEFLQPLNIEFKSDKVDKSYFYYKNYVVEVTKNSIIPLPYETLEGNIWENQIIQRDFKLSENKSVFDKFLLNICKKNEDRYNSIISAIGYLLHTYKDVNNTKAIIFLDEKLSEAAFGRSGKGLVSSAIKKLRAMVRLDGRNFNFDKSFAFQLVNLDTDIIFFDDTSKKFNFDRLFSIITEGMTIEKKNKTEIYIPFSDSPKILISTNYSIKGTDDSTLDREFVIEFSDFYNKNHRPINDFGHRFFEDWSDEEWITFDNTMLKYMQFYLNNGLVEYEHVNLKMKQLIDSTSPDFADFIKEKQLNKEYNKKNLFLEFKEEYPEYQNMKQNTFTSWIKSYANLYELFYKQRKSGKDRYFILVDKNNKDEVNNVQEGQNDELFGHDLDEKSSFDFYER